MRVTPSRSHGSNVVRRRALKTNCNSKSCQCTISISLLHCYLVMIRRGRAEGWLRLPIQSLPSWATLNNVQFNGITVAPQRGLEDRGSTVIAQQTLRATEPATALMVVPRDLILSLERVLDHAKYDADFREVLDSLGDFGRVSPAD